MDTAQILSEINKLASEVQKSQGAQTANLISTEERRGYNNEERQRNNTDHILNRLSEYNSQTNDNVHYYGSENQAATIRASGDIRTLQQQIGARQAVQGEKIAGELIWYQNEQSNRSTAQHGDTIYKIKDLHADIGDYFKSTQREVLAVGAGLERQSAAEFTATQTGLLKVENSLGRQADYHFAKLQNQAAVNYNQIQVQALQVGNDISKQMMKCCCEIKERIDSSEKHIKDLINNNEAADLRLRITAQQTHNMLRGAREFGPNGLQV